MFSDIIGQVFVKVIYELNSFYCWEKGTLKKTLFTIMFIMLLISMLMLTFNTQQTRASATIFIRPDGNIEPPTAPILRIGDLYIITDNIYESIVIQRNNMTLDGAGFTIQGGGEGNGIELADITNVTVANAVVCKFNFGIYVNCSSEIKLFNNLITEISWGAGIEIVSSSNNTVFDNNLSTISWGTGIQLSASSNNTLQRNNVDTVYMGSGIHVLGSAYNNISDNYLTRANSGMSFDNSFRNDISSNNIVENIDQGVIFSNSSNNNIIGNFVSANNIEGIVFSASSNNSVSGNNITRHSYDGILVCLRSFNNCIASNNLYDNDYAGILNSYSNHTSIIDNKITSSQLGILFWNSANSMIVRNNIIANDFYGIGFENSLNNFISHNSFVNNTNQAYNLNSINVWDDGYPSGGNYWSDQDHGFCADHYRGPDQNEPKSDDSPDGIVDKPYIIDDNNRDRYPLMKPYAGLHDIGIINVTTSKNVVGQNYNISSNVRIINYGMEIETFNVTIQMNLTKIQTQKTALDVRNSITLTFTWTIPSTFQGNYTIIAYAEPVQDEIDITDNTYINGWVFVTIPGDINGDKVVNIKDAALLGVAFGSKQGQPSYNPNADINGDGYVNIKDAVIQGVHFGQSLS